MKSTSILLILAMVGTGFGQTTTIQPNTGTVNGRCWFVSPDGSHQRGTCPEWVISTDSPNAKLCEKADGHGKRTPASCGDEVDVPAIQERYLAHHAGEKSACPNSVTANGIDLGMLCGYMVDDYEKRWTCADENRALLTSVNGKRHSCHLIQEGK